MSRRIKEHLLPILQENNRGSLSQIIQEIKTTREIATETQSAAVVEEFDRALNLLDSARIILQAITDIQ